MEYSAVSVKFLLWYVETKETAKLLRGHTFDEIKEIVFQENLYQQKARARQQSGCYLKWSMKSIGTK